jgi:tRNA A37 threonylcarbamoyladenosine synthetase subunit TsaC/SUA5/YrdC
VSEPSTIVRLVGEEAEVLREGKGKIEVAGIKK